MLNAPGPVIASSRKPPGDGQVFHEHQRVHAFRKVAVEDKCSQQREARREQCSRASQEAEQNRQTAAKLKQNGQGQQEPWDTHRFHVLLRLMHNR